MSNTPSFPRKRRKEARPSELAEAALDLFVEKGFAATRLEDVAKRAGVSKGTLYLYFDGKEALFKAVIQEGILPVLEEGETIVARHEGSAYELLQRLLQRWWVLVGETRLSGISKLMVSEARNFPEAAQFYYDNVIRRSRALVAATLRRGIESGEFRSVDIETCIDLVIAPVLMLNIWRHSMACCLGGQVNPQEYLSLHLDLLRRGLQVAEL